MRGGLVDTDRQVLAGLGFTEEQINYLFANNPDMMIEFFQNSINPPPGNPFYTEAQTPAQIIQSLVEINNEYDGDNSEGHTTGELETDSDLNIVTDNSLNNAVLDISTTGDNPLNNSDLDVSLIQGNTNNTLSDESIDTPFGGKRKSKRRTTNKRKTKKSRKTRKHRKRRQRGGAMTTSVDYVLDNDEQEYIDYKKLMSRQ
jgi:hypothetical protein